MKWNEVLIVSLKTTSHQSKKEIIEFGIGEFSIKDRRLTEKMSVFVKPQASKLTDFCSNMTGVTASDLSDAVSFFDLYEFVSTNFDSKNLPWVSYGNFAETVLKRQCADNSLDFLMSERFLNLRHFFSFLNNSEEMNIQNTLAEMGVCAGGSSCEDEIYNCAIIMKKMLCLQK